MMWCGRPSIRPDARFLGLCATYQSNRPAPSTFLHGFLKKKDNDIFQLTQPSWRSPPLVFSSTVPLAAAFSTARAPRRGHGTHSSQPSPARGTRPAVAAASTVGATRRGTARALLRALCLVLVISDNA
jgi:hypothetical protein